MGWIHHSCNKLLEGRSYLSYQGLSSKGSLSAWCQKPKSFVDELGWQPGSDSNVATEMGGAKQKNAFWKYKVYWFVIFWGLNNFFV